jgi:hypothetical protein
MDNFLLTIYNNLIKREYLLFWEKSSYIDLIRRLDVMKVSHITFGESAYGNLKHAFQQKGAHKNEKVIQGLLVNKN